MSYIIIADICHNHFLRAGVLFSIKHAKFWPALAHFDQFWLFCREYMRFLVYFLQAFIMWRCTKIDKYQVWESRVSAVCQARSDLFPQMLSCHNAMSAISFDFDEIHEKRINEQRLKNCVYRGLFTLNHFCPKYFGQFSSCSQVFRHRRKYLTYRGT